MTDQLPTAEEITIRFLYGTETVPNNLVDPALIRPADTTSTVQIDVGTFMTSGAGRFAVGRQFELVNRFFTDSIAPGTYTKQQVAEHFSLSRYDWEMQQYNFQDSVDDYATRTYLYNTMSFQIADGTVFVVTGSGERRIENFAIIPWVAVPENFDFSSDNWLAQIASLKLEPQIRALNSG